MCINFGTMIFYVTASLEILWRTMDISIVCLTALSRAHQPPVHNKTVTLTQCHTINVKLSKTHYHFVQTPPELHHHHYQPQYQLRNCKAHFVNIPYRHVYDSFRFDKVFHPKVFLYDPKRPAPPFAASSPLYLVLGSNSP